MAGGAEAKLLHLTTNFETTRSQVSTGSNRTGCGGTPNRWANDDIRSIGIGMDFVFGSIQKRVDEGIAAVIALMNWRTSARAAQAIIGELKLSPSRKLPHKIVAQQALQIFENLNARPPGWLATAGLLFVHVASVALAVVFVLVFKVAQHTDLRAALTALRGPQHEFVCAPAVVWPGAPAAGPAPAAQNTLVATFPARRPAQAAFDSLTPRLPANSSLRLFGDSVLLSLPADQDAARQEWLGELQRLTKDVLVDNTNSPLRLTVSGRAPDIARAQELESELTEYFNTLPAMALVPPWLPHDPRTPDETGRHRLARATYLKLQAAKWQNYDDPAVRALRQKIAGVQRLGDRTTVTALRLELKSLMADTAKRRLAEVAAGAQGPVDSAVVGLFAALPAGTSRVDQEAEQPPLREIARLMGQYPAVNSQSPPGAELFSSPQGAVSR